MKKLSILFLITKCLILNAQKTYLDENKVQVADPSYAKYYRIVESSDNLKGYKEVCYYLSGEKESENTFLHSPDGFVKNGKSTSWYINGQLKNESTFLKGEQVGTEITYYDNGQVKSEIILPDSLDEKHIKTYWYNGVIKRNDLYKKNKFEKGICYDSLGNEVKHFDYEIMPQYKGGDQRLLNDIANNLNYPIRSRDAGIQGRVLVRFVVTPDGSVSSVSILEGVNPEMNEEAIRVVKNLKKFKPGLLDGEPVPVFYMLPISFNLR